MYELKYKLTDDDIKSVNKSIALFYFSLYLAVAVIGIAVGIIAVVLSSQAMMYVLGVILIVLGAILGVCAVMLMVTPKHFVASAIPTGNDDLTVNVDGYGIRVDSKELKLMIRYSDVTKVKARKNYILVYVGKDKVFMIKNAIRTGLTLNVLYELIKSKSQDAVDPAVLQAVSQKYAEDGSEDSTDENTDEPEVDNAEENADEETTEAEGNS